MSKLRKLEEYIKRAIEILKSKDGAFFTVQGSRVDDNDLLGRIIEILTNHRGELKISLERIEEIAKRLVPSVKAFYESEEGRRKYEEWEKEQKNNQNLKIVEEKTE